MKTVAYLLFLFAAGCIVGHVCGCTSAEVRAEHAAINLGYDEVLVRCKSMGKDAGAFAVFEACERAASRKLCAEHVELRPTWKRCAEVFP